MSKVALYYMSKVALYRSGYRTPISLSDERDFFCRNYTLRRYCKDKAGISLRQVGWCYETWSDNISVNICDNISVNICDNISVDTGGDNISVNTATRGRMSLSDNRERIFLELMTSDRGPKESKEGSK